MDVIGSVMGMVIVSLDEVVLVIGGFLVELFPMCVCVAFVVMPRIGLRVGPEGDGSK